MFGPSSPALSGVLDPRDSSPDARALLRDWLALNRALALAPGRAAEHLRRARGPRDALRAAGRRGPPRSVVDADLSALQRCGAVALPLSGAAYPPSLARLADPPPLLFARGDLGALRARCVAIVGSRAATVYGQRIARGLAADLAREGVVVVSGLALGVDAAAHRGALEGGGRTVAVLPCGPDRVYPARHRELAGEIARRGTVVTELPLGMAPRRTFFSLRNRLIAALSDGVIVVEARARSGTLVTAGHAADQGVDVFAVPGPVDAPTSAGPNALLHAGCHVVRHADDVLDALAFGESPVQTRRRLPERASPPVSPDAAAILAALAEEPLSRDGLCRRLDRAPQDLACEILELELEGRLAADRDGRLRVL